MNHRSISVGLVLALFAGALVLTGALPANAVVTQTSASWVVPPSGAESAGSPALTRTANGDILLAYPTGHEDTNASIRVRRSTDNGVTWSGYTEIFTGSSGINGNTAVGMTTLSDGTILVPFTIGLVENKYTRRTTTTYIARSTDNGVTWAPSSISTPVTLPAPWNGTEVFNATYGRIVDLGGGQLLLPVFGSPTQTPAIGTTNASLSNPVPWAAGVFRSADNGATWSSYSEIGTDRSTQSLYFNDNGFLPTASTEPTITRLNDGRLLALLRYDTTVATQVYFASYSSDGGLTWSAPVRTTLNGRGGTVDHAPCSSDLPSGRSKVMAAYLDFTTAGSVHLAIRSSYDNGASWSSATVVNRPAGSSTAGYDFYPDMLELPGNKLLVVYTAAVAGLGNRVASAVIQDSDAATCVSELAANDAAVATTLNLVLQSGDADQQSWLYGSRTSTASATTLVSQVILNGAPQATCGASPVGAYKNGVLLNPATSLAANGVVNGDTIQFRGTPWTGFTKGGFVDVDGGYLRSSGFISDPSIQHKLAGFTNVCDYKIGMDYRGRSVGATFTVATGQMVTAFHIRDSDALSTIPTSAFTVWKSFNNSTWSQVAFTLTKTTDSAGRQTLHFGGLSTAGPYLKVNVNTASTTPQIIINSIQNDVWVTCNYAAGGCPAT